MIAAARTGAVFSYGGAVADVEVDSPDIDRWLREFLQPAMAAAPLNADGPSPGVAVRLRSSDTEWEHLRRTVPAEARPIGCFAFDSRIVQLPSWQEGDRTLVEDAHHQCFYLVRGDSVEIVGSGAVPRIRMGLMRVVREALTSRRLAQEPLLDLHAAAFAGDRGAVLIAGARYAGKTTLLCYGLHAEGTRFIANDRVLVSLDAKGARAFGGPTLVSVRPPTVTLFPTLNAGDSPAPDRAHALSPPQFAARLGRAIIGDAPVAAIVFPEITGEVEGWTLEPLTAGEAHRRLAGCFYGVRRGAVKTVFAPRDSDALVADPYELAGRFAARVRCFRCRLGPQAYRRAAEEWVRALA